MGIAYVANLWHVNQFASPAFTLAEVLIVLGIIGLIADMTIPTIIQRTQEKVAVTKLKKVYSTLQSAYTLAAQEYDSPDNWDLKEKNSIEGAKNAKNIILSFLIGTDISQNNVAIIQLNDGIKVDFEVLDSACNSVMGNTPALSNS